LLVGVKINEGVFVMKEFIVPGGTRLNLVTTPEEAAKVKEHDLVPVYRILKKEENLVGWALRDETLIGVFEIIVDLDARGGSEWGEMRILSIRTDA
jgi:hypothetical protein